MPHIICDIGSTHGNSLDYMKRAIDVVKQYGIGVSLKCQLFGPEQAVGGNVELDHGLFLRACIMAARAGVDMFASVWRSEDYLAAVGGCDSVKFAYSQRNSPLIAKAIDDFDTVYVSMQHLDLPGPQAPNAKRLLCIPEYPVYWDLNFEDCFPTFDGFSDHSLGIGQTIHALESGARIVEKHVKFNGFSDCPDARFAIDEKQLERLVEYGR